LFDLAAEVHDATAEVLRPGGTEQDVIRALQPIKEAGLIIQCSGLHGWGQTLERPTIGLPGVGRWIEGGIAPFTFRENMTMMIEPNPVTPDRKMGMFAGNLHWVTDKGAVNLQAYPLKLVVV
jgi:Xaa-Pro aminopeptidase